MFFGKQQTGFMNQPPAVNMVNQPGTVPGMPATGMPQDAFGYTQPAMGDMAPDAMYAQGPMTPDMYVPGQMAPDVWPQLDTMYPQMGFVCEPCDQHHHCPPQPQPQVYVVQKGDTVYKIAQRYGLDWRELAGYNRLGNPDLIYPGERLFIPPR